MKLTSNEVVHSRLNKRKFFIAATICFTLYVGAFVIVHRSSTFRRPAANMMYWYYSDNPVVENVEFYGFWPLRQIAYRVPGFMSRHNRERIYNQESEPGV